MPSLMCKSLLNLTYFIGVLISIWRCLRELFYQGKCCSALHYYSNHEPNMLCCRLIISVHVHAARVYKKQHQLVQNLFQV